MAHAVLVVWLVGCQGSEGTPDAAPPDAAPVGQGSEPRGDVVVNEVNPDGPDWIELANRGQTTIDLSGWFVTDATDRLDHYYALPVGTMLAAGAYLVVWADEGTGDFHAPFKLGQSDGAFLVAPDGLVADGLLYFSPDGGALSRVPDREGLFYRAAATPATGNAP